MPASKDDFEQGAKFILDQAGKRTGVDLRGFSLLLEIKEYLDTIRDKDSQIVAGATGEGTGFLMCIVGGVEYSISVQATKAQNLIPRMPARLVKDG